MSEALFVAGTLLVDVFLLATGESLRWALTLGGHQPRWELCTGQRPPGFALHTEPSTWLGAAFWLTFCATAISLLP